ncbi:ribonuclease H protein [Pyrus ussuriensis x Pyrus communis]|uniref:Ribonuclease H protein n=1 Tax=Pyrus ussuriensis x Pyrus communis TaxID=2448454 RepID=A0A5N5HSJ8_9ROSA|nr:ribonuclease H protein [Pyrus ussuriensis x Pyrus communis]
MAEAEAVRVALVACVEKGFGLVQIETDSKVLMDMLTGVPWDISHLKQQLSSIEFLFTPRSCNRAIHLVATHVTCVGDVICGIVMNRSGYSML